VQMFFHAFMHENALNPLVFPSLKQFETEIVAMVANMLHGDGRVVGAVITLCAHTQAGLSNRCCLSTVSQSVCQSVSLSVCWSLFEARFSGTYFAVQAMKMATYSQSLAY